MNNLSNSDFQPNEINIKEQLFYYLSYWKWLVLSCFLAFAVAYVYLRYTTPIYSATTSILVNDKKGGANPEIAIFSELGVKSSKNNMNNEIELLKSRTLIEQTVARMGLHINYVNEGLIKSGESYKNSPIQLVFVDSIPVSYALSGSLRVVSDGTSFFELYEATNKLGRFAYGQTIATRALGAIQIQKVPASSLIRNKDSFDLQITVQPVVSVAQSYRGRLAVYPLNKEVNIVQLSITDTNHERAVDFLNGLLDSYNQDVINDKNMVSKKTSEFIAERLKLITSELDLVEKDVEGYKRNEGFVDISYETGINLGKSETYEEKILEIETQLHLVDDVMNLLKNTAPLELIPMALPPEMNASSLIGEYNQLILERNRIIKSSTPSNPAVVNIDAKMQFLRLNVTESLQQYKNNLLLKKRDLNRQDSKISGKLSKIPTQEREFKIIDRQQKIKESLYLYLLQKREETAISLAVTAPSVKVFDEAHSSKYPISPNRRNIYLIALAIGLVVPLGILYLIQLLDTKVKTRYDIEKNVSVPFLGEVPTSESNTEIINFNSRSGSAEALRIVRTNLEFMLSQVGKGRAKTIFLTSSMPKEGKTFVSLNLAGTIALSEKKVLLMGMDLRHPKLQNYLKLPAQGLTNYLSKEEASIDSYIVKIEGYKNFYVLPSGIIPPNPAELLMGPKIEELFEKLKQEYDYIVVDTAPVTLVTDSLLIAKYADAFIFVVRANYLEKQMLRIPQQMYQEKKLPNMSILLNDVDISNKYGYGGGYGYGYGYGPETETEPWYKRFFSKTKS